MRWKLVTTTLFCGIYCNDLLAMKSSVCPESKPPKLPTVVQRIPLTLAKKTCRPISRTPQPPELHDVADMDASILMEVPQKQDKKRSASSSHARTQKRTQQPQKKYKKTSSDTESQRKYKKTSSDTEQVVRCIRHSVSESQLYELVGESDSQESVSLEISQNAQRQKSRPRVAAQRKIQNSQNSDETTSEDIPSVESQPYPIVSISYEQAHSERIRHRRLSSYQSQKNIYLEIFLNELEPLVNRSLKQELSLGFSGLIDTIVNKIETEGIKDLSHQEFLVAHLKHDQTFRYVRRANRSEREQMAIYSYADDMLASGDGLFNRIKRNVLDAMCIQVNIYNALMELKSPNDQIDEEKFLQYIEAYIDNIFEAMLPKITGTVFSLISDLISEPCCGCFAKSGLSYNERIQFASRAGTFLKGVFKNFLNEDIVDGAADLISMVSQGITQRANRSVSDINTAASADIPIFDQD